jgi:bifunctional non-homologous end joining protein LigD
MGRPERRIRNPARPPALQDLPGARRAALPPFVAPQLATPSATVKDAGYVHEIKLDGYRVLVRLEHGRARLFTRRAHDWTARLPVLAHAFEALPLSEAMFDGEVVVLDASGVSDFQRLQNSLSAGRDAACVYFAFDLLHLSGYDLRALPLLERKRILRETLAAPGVHEGRIRFSDHAEGSGAHLLEHACALGLEGIVSKRADAPYTSGRTRHWLKLKCNERQEFVVGGYTAPSGARGHFGALLLGVYDARGRLGYAGKVGTGFTARSLAELHARLSPLERPEPVFHDPPRGADARGVHWLHPELVAEVEYSERTRDGLVRQATFRGMRSDKLPREIRFESPTARARAAARSRAPVRARSSGRGVAAPEHPVSRIRLTHPERVLYPEQGLTKRDLVAYYAAIAPFMLPHLARRPLALLRCPEGHGTPCFFYKHPAAGVPVSVRRVAIRERSKRLDSMYVEDLEGLLGLVQVGALEIHTWGSRIEHLEQPDQLVFDLDPDEGLPWAQAIDAAHDVRATLAGLGLSAFLKTTGGKGLHVVVPVEPRLEWHDAKQFCHRLAQRMVRAHPTRYVASVSKAKRRGKVFVDYLRNGRGATAACAYSTRARSEATVAMPIEWDELTLALRSDRFTVASAPGHVATRARDPWVGFEESRVSISSAARRALGLR